MREILFRAKRDKAYCPSQDWTYGVPFIDHEGDCIFKTNASEFVVDPETVGQYTGLTDKNGKKIFEGDVVKCRHTWRLQKYPRNGIDEEKYFFEQKIRGAYGKYKEENPYWMGDAYHYFRNYVVEYYAPNSGYRVRNGGQFHALTSSYISNRDLEIIGNIHDNPELLKGE